MRAEQETLAHRVQHHPEAAHRHGKAQFVLAHPGPHRRVEQPQEATVPPAGILDDGHRHHRAAARAETRHHGIGFVAVIESPSTQPRQRVGRGIEHHALKPVKRCGLVGPDKVQVRLDGTGHFQALDIVGNHLGRALVFLGKRDEIGHPLRHVAETCVQFAAPTADDLGTQSHRRALARRLQALEKATANLGRIGHGRVTVAEQQRQLGILAERLAITLDKLLQFHITQYFGNQLQI